MNRFSDRIDTPGFRLAAFVLVLLAAVAVGWCELMQGLDLKLLDTQFRQLRIWHPRPVARDVVVIGIDEDTAEGIPEPFTLWHRHFGSLFAAMALAKPATLGVDVVLPSRSYEPVAAGLDRELMKGILAARGHSSWPSHEGLTGKSKPRCSTSLNKKTIGEVKYETTY